MNIKQRGGALEAILNRPKTVFFVMIMLLIGGISAYLGLPRESDPNIEVPVYYVSIPAPGASAKDVDKLVISPLESELKGMDGLKNVFTIATEGYAAVVLEFDISADAEKSLRDIRVKVDDVTPQLPEVANEPTVNEVSFSSIPMVIVTLSGNVPDRTLIRYANDLADAIEAVPNVRSADVIGAREEVLEVIVDTLKLQSYNLTQNEIINAVLRNNQLISAGDLNNELSSFAIKVPGLFETERDILDLPVRVSGAGVVRISDVASIHRTYKEATTYSRFNGKSGISVNVLKRLGANVVNVTQEVREIVDEMSAKWPDAIEVTTTFDRSNVIFEVISSLENSIFTSVFLVMMLVLVSLGWRPSLLVGLCFPIIYSISFLILQLMGYTLNTMVLFGLVLTVGMLVDNGIVIVEYSDRKVAEGYPRRQAFKEAAHRMFWPVLASTSTTLAAFIPILFWPGVSGQFMANIPIMVIIVLSSSFFTATILIPVLGYFIGRRKKAEHAEWMGKISEEKDFDYGELPLFLRAYARFLKIATYLSPITVLAVIGLVGGIMYYYSQHSTGLDFFVDAEPEQINVYVSDRGNLSAQQRLGIMKQVESRILKVQGIKNVSSSILGGGGFDLLGGEKPSDTTIQFNIELDKFGTRPPGKEIINNLRIVTADVPGVKISVAQRDQGPPEGKGLQIRIGANNYEEVLNQGRRVKEYLTSLPYAFDYEDDLPLPGIDWQVQVNREEAARYGADIQSVGNNIQLVTSGVKIGTYRPNDTTEELEIRLRLPADERTFERLGSLVMITPVGQVPISHFVTVEPTPALSVIRRTNGNYSVTMKTALADQKQVEEAKAEAKEWIDSRSWPNSFTWRFVGADEEQQQSQQFLSVAGTAAILLMFLILIVMFNSVSQTFLTLTTVVMSIGGVLLGLLLMQQKFSIIMTGIGIVGLAGVVVNNAIILLDSFNELCAKGIERMDAMIRAAVQRVRPILLTTSTTILGLIPSINQFNFDFSTLSFSDGGITSIWWVQLATAISFGLGFSAILTLIFIPSSMALMIQLSRLSRRIWSFTMRKLFRRNMAPQSVA